MDNHSKDNAIAMPLRILGYGFAGIILFTGGVFIGGANSQLIQQIIPDNNESRNLVEGDYSLLNEVRSLISSFHLDVSPEETPTDTELVDGAVKGLVSAYNDKYTNYYSAEEWADLQKDNAGEFEGIGIKIVGTDDYAMVETPITGAPAQKAGIMSQDLIVEVDGVSTLNMSIGEVAELIKGPEGSEVIIQIYRPSADETLEFKVERNQIDIESVTAIQIADDTTLITISQFTENSIYEFRTQWNSAVELAVKNNSDKIVLDLRNNTGGWVAAARLVLEEFLPEDTLILIEEDVDGNRTEVYTQSAGKLQDKKVTVLVNQGSASASEIVAGALQDLDKAELVGKPTIGKGVEQTVQELSNGGRLFIVFKKWLTPSGRNLSQENALAPDHEVDITTEDVKSGKDPQLEKALKIME